MEKVNNLELVPFGEWYPCDPPLIGYIVPNENGLDYYEQRILDTSLKVVGFWAPFGDRSLDFMRVVIDTSEFPVEQIPFLRMKLYLCKMNDSLKAEWVKRRKVISEQEVERREL